jgi:hypothetical protein
MSADLNEIYENFALLRDSSAAAILPKLAADLSSILFAISIDVPELNVASSKSPTAKTEPIIAVPNSSNVIKTSTGKHRRNIEEFEETVKAGEVQAAAIVEASSPPPYESQYKPETIPNFSDRISIISNESSPSNFTMKDDDTISQSSSSSEEEFSSARTSTPKAARANPRAGESSAGSNA